MSRKVHDVVLRGCAPEPMADYLKALGVLRLVAEQADAAARGWWRGDAFILRSELDVDGLIEFLLTRYVPTPIIAPWNGGSGFYEKDGTAREVLAEVDRYDDARFTVYRETIRVARRVLETMRIAEKPDKDVKQQLLRELRAWLPDAGLSWLDAAVVLTEQGPRYPALLGTGGNDGRLDFTSNQMQRLLELVGPRADASRSRRALRGSLYREIGDSLLVKRAVGQFAPAAVGGANASMGFGRDSLVNPWDYVLLLEGALMFAAAVTRRLESTTGAGMAFPFAVRATGAGYGSASSEDESGSREELWLPLWSRPAGLAELAGLLSEGRARAEGRTARTAVDFARAVATLGIDRGIGSFVRYGFHVRNGLAYFATPLGRWRVSSAARPDPLRHIAGWVERLRLAADRTGAPASLRTARGMLDEAVLAYCAAPDPSAACGILMALGEVEAVLSRAPRTRADAVLPPIPPLPRRWLRDANDDTPEFRLAAALASAGLREHLAPVDGRGWAEESPRFVWTNASLVTNLLGVLGRRDKDGDPPRATYPRYAALGDVAAFIDGVTDDERLEALLRGLAAVDWRGIDSGKLAFGPPTPLPPAGFALLALVHHRLRPPVPVESEFTPDQQPLPVTPGLVARAASGDLWGATRMASRRLIGSGYIPRIDACQEPEERARRCAAALLFPLSIRARAELAKRALVIGDPDVSQTMEAGV